MLCVTGADVRGSDADATASQLAWSKNRKHLGIFTQDLNAVNVVCDGKFEREFSGQEDEYEQEEEMEALSLRFKIAHQSFSTKCCRGGGFYKGRPTA